MNDLGGFQMLPEELARIKIDKQLQDSGWDIVSRMEYIPNTTSAVKEALMKGSKESDYLLFVEDKAIPLRSKIITIAIMWLSTIITSLLLVGYWWVKALLGLISIGVSWHILSYPTKKE